MSAIVRLERRTGKSGRILCRLLAPESRFAGALAISWLRGD